MAVQSASYPTTPPLEAPHRDFVASGTPLEAPHRNFVASGTPLQTARGGAWRALALVSLGVGLGSAGRWMPAPSDASLAAASLATGSTATQVTSTSALAPAAPSGPKVAFLARANGVITQPVELVSLPGGGRVLVAIDPGAAVEVGGLVNVRAGLTRRPIYWVRLVEPPQSYGFVPADAVAVPGDMPISPIDVNGLGEADWLAPAVGVQQAQGGVSSLSPDASDVQPSWLPETVRRFGALLAEAGLKHGVDPALLAIVTLVESGGYPSAVSGSGARGLMQIMPGTAASIGRACVDSPFDPATSIDCGADYLAAQLMAFGLADDPDWATSVERAAAAYNGGPNSVKSWLAGGNLPAEAERYRRWVGGMWRERADEDSATYRTWLAAGGAKLVKAAEADAVRAGSPNGAGSES